jgi:hypothetical protein
VTSQAGQEKTSLERQIRHQIPWKPAELPDTMAPETLFPARRREVGMNVCGIARRHIDVVLVGDIDAPRVTSFREIFSTTRP